MGRTVWVLYVICLSFVSILMVRDDVGKIDANIEMFNRINNSADVLIEQIELVEFVKVIDVQN